MTKNKENWSNFNNIIKEFSDNDNMLLVITKLLDCLNSIDPGWKDTINMISKIPLTKKFKNKIKLFFENVDNDDYLLILNVLLEGYKGIHNLPDDIKEKSFYVILRDLPYFLNSYDNSHKIYSRCVKYIRVFKTIIIEKN